MPSRLLDLQLSDTVTMVNVAQLNAPIPVDLISFGYYSLGVPGVIIICILFGSLLRVFEILLPLNVHKVFVIFRFAWMVFLTFMIMYADPCNVIKTGFGLFVATPILFLLGRRGIIFPKNRTSDYGGSMGQVTCKRRGRTMKHEVTRDMLKPKLRDS